MADSPRFTWDAELGRFRYASSDRLVPTKLIRNAIDIALDNQKQRAGQLIEQVGAGALEPAEWELAMRRLIKDSHLYTTAAARGGFAQLSQADFGRAGGHIAREYAYLRGFRQGLESGERTADGRGLRDAQSYADAARRTFHNAERVTRDEIAAQGGGHWAVKSIRHATDSCGECIALEEAGEMDPDEMPDPGERECGNGCKCEIEWIWIPDDSAPAEAGADSADGAG